MLPLPELDIATLRLHYTAREQVHFPQEPISIWRGQLGRYLHNVSPPTDEADRHSLYHLFFETPRATFDLAERMEAKVLGRLGLQGSHVPHPFVLRGYPLPNVGGSLILAPGDVYTLEIVLMGEALSYIPALCATFQAVGGWGLGRRVKQRSGKMRRGRLALTRAALIIDRVHLHLYDGHTWTLPDECGPHLCALARQLQHPAPADPTTQEHGLMLRTKTPLHLNYQRATVRPHTFNLVALGNAAIRRILALAACYSTCTIASKDLDASYLALDALIDATTCQHAFTWKESRRYSARQQSAVPLRGLWGTLCLDASPDVLTHWQRLFDPLSRIHVGKWSSMGYGWLALANRSSSKQAA